MHTWITALITIALALGGGCAASWAEERGNGDKGQDRMEILRMWKMMDALDLDKPTADRIFEIRRKFNSERKKLQEAVQDDFRKLRRVMKDTKESNEQEVQKLLSSIRENRKRLESLWNDQYEAVSKVLSVLQQAKLMIFLKDFNREISSMFQGPRPPHPPFSGGEMRGQGPSQPGPQMRGQGLPPFGPQMRGQGPPAAGREMRGQGPPPPGIEMQDHRPGQFGKETPGQGPPPPLPGRWQQPENVEDSRDES